MDERLAGPNANIPLSGQKLAEELAMQQGPGDPIDLIRIAGTHAYAAAERRKAERELPQTGLIIRDYGTANNTTVTLIGTKHPKRPSPAHPELVFLGEYVEGLSDGQNTVLILEGLYGQSDTVLPGGLQTTAGEFSLMASVAERCGVEVIPAEPDPHDTAREIIAAHPEFTPEQIALHYALKSLPGTLGNESKPIDAIAPILYYNIGIAGNANEGGMVSRVLSRSDAMALDQNALRSIATEIEMLIPRLNTAFAEIKPGETLFVRNPNGTYKLGFDLTAQPVLWDPDPSMNGFPETPITHISRLDMLARDRNTFALTREAAKTKSVIVAVGSSHLSTMEPAFDAAFTAR